MREEDTLWNYTCGGNSHVLISVDNSLCQLPVAIFSNFIYKSSFALFFSFLSSHTEKKKHILLCFNLDRNAQSWVLAAMAGRKRRKMKS